MRADGVLKEDHVVVVDEAQANRLHNKGSFGAPQTGNSLRLDLVEAAYLIDAERLRVEGHDFGSLLSAGDGNETRYLVYRDLRERGLVVQVRGDCLVAWQRGEGPSKEPWFTTRPFAERTPVAPGDIAPDCDTVSVVDEDGQVTHYSASFIAPAGSVPLGSFPSGPARQLGDHILVEDEALAAELNRQYLGTPHGTGRLLSLVEAHHVRASLGLGADFAQTASATQPQFDAVWPVHDALRAAGVVTRSGFRFGTHLRGYEGNPDEGHAPWLFHCAESEELLSWSTLSRGIRLAHGVRKHFVVAWGPEPVKFLALAWFRP